VVFLQGLMCCRVASNLHRRVNEVSEGPYLRSHPIEKG
jgi:hypothetical protein